MIRFSSSKKLKSSLHNSCKSFLCKKQDASDPHKKTRSYRTRINSTINEVEGSKVEKVLYKNRGFYNVRRVQKGLCKLERVCEKLLDALRVSAYVYLSVSAFVQRGTKPYLPRSAGPMPICPLYQKQHHVQETIKPMGSQGYGSSHLSYELNWSARKHAKVFHRCVRSILWICAHVYSRAPSIFLVIL